MPSDVVRRAILAKLPDLILSAPHELPRHVRASFAGAFDAVADNMISAGRIRDHVELGQLLRGGIPFEACTSLSEFVGAESLFPVALRERLLRTFQLLQGRIDKTFPVEHLSDDSEITAMVDALYGDVVKHAIRRDIDGLPAQVADTVAGVIGGAREDRLQLFLEERRISGVAVSLRAVYATARVDRADFGRWRRGELSDRSGMAARIESVLSGRWPLFYEGKRGENASPHCAPTSPRPYAQSRP